MDCGELIGTWSDPELMLTADELSGHLGHTLTGNADVTRLSVRNLSDVEVPLWFRFIHLSDLLTLSSEHLCWTH